MATKQGNAKKCNSCGADGHCRVTYRGCINYKKPKDQWKRVDAATGDTAGTAAAKVTGNTAGTTGDAAKAPAAASAAAAQCKSCLGDGHKLQTNKKCINYGKKKGLWKKWDGSELPSAPVKKGKEKKEKWAKSRGKLLLRDKIIAGEVTSKSDPKVVHPSHPEWKKWPFDNFKTNLKNLIEAVALDYKRLAEDCEAFGHDMALLKEVREKDPNPPPTPWHMSAAKPLLLQDIDAGKHKKMLPNVLWETRIEFMEFGLKVFRDHLYQELDKRDKKDSRFQKKKKRLAPPPRATVVDEAAMDLINGAK